MTSPLQHVLLYFHHLFYLGGGFKIWDSLSICLFLSFLICHLCVSYKHTRNVNLNMGMEYTYPSSPVARLALNYGCNVEGECFTRLIMEF